MNKPKFIWKQLETLSPNQILFDQNYQFILNNIICHKITEFEVDNLPSNYIVSFINILQNYIYNFMQNENDNNKKDIYEQKISEKNQQIGELNKEIMKYQEIINKKDKLLNDTHKKIFSLNNQLYELKREYKIKLNKYKNEYEDQIENYKEMDEKYYDTFRYLSNLYLFSPLGKNLEKNNTKNSKKDLNNNKEKQEGKK